MRVRQTVRLAVIIPAVLYATAGHAITTVESNAGIQFNFGNPGARSLGMGGAFLGLADDATAAYANPAGLSNLFRPEFSIEYRHNEFTTVYSDRGRQFGTPTNTGIDTVSGIVQEDEDSSTDSLSFLSFVFPQEKWTIGAYRHQLANFETNYFSQGPIQQNRDDFVSRSRPTQNSVDLNIVNWGVSLSYRITDALSIGANVSYMDFEIDSRTLRYPLETGDDRTNPADYSQAPEFDITQNGDDDDFAYNLGLLWKITDKWSVGAVYRSGAEFDYEYMRLDTRPTPVFEPVIGMTDFDLPSAYGVGVAFRPVDQLTINFDFNRINYSELTEDVVLEDTGESFPFIELDDGDEYRLGLEYVFATNTPFAIRAGIWQAPDTVLAYDGPLEEVTDSDTAEQATEKTRRNVKAAFFQQGDEETHYSVGAGLVLGQFQIDAAADFADTGDTYSLSAVIFF